MREILCLMITVKIIYSSSELFLTAWDSLRFFVVRNLGCPRDDKWMYNLGPAVKPRDDKVGNYNTVN